MGLIDYLLGRNNPPVSEKRESWIESGYSFTDYLTFMVNGNTYGGFSQTLTGSRESIDVDFEGIVAGAYKRDGIVFACEMARLLVFTEARFQFQQMSGGRPGDLFGTPDLSILERPWDNATTGDLLGRMLLDADFAGNAYVTRSVRTGGRIRRLRPDRVAIVLGSMEDAEQPEDALDCTVLGYSYKRSKDRPAEFLPADEVAHFAWNPDPVANYRGMSWLTPILREVMGDKAATEHKLRFFENGATPNMVIKMDPQLTPEQVNEFADAMEQDNSGVLNAYRTLYLGGGADVQVVGKDFQQLDFKVTQGAGETRIAAAARVHPVIVGLSEGLAGSSLNAGNFASARRSFADGTLRPLWRNIAGSLETVVRPPAGARLWYDDRDIAFLREDAKDAAEIQQVQATTIKSLIDAGYDPDSARDAVISGDFKKLTHTGLYSVQLQPPNSMVDTKPSTGARSAPFVTDLGPQTVNIYPPNVYPPNIQVDVAPPDVRVENTVPQPEVNVAAPNVQVDVAAPDVRIENQPPNVQVDVAAPNVQLTPMLPAPEVTVTLPRSTRRVVRDQQGNITKVVEE